jgi:CheY-like chemotaxis protein
MPHKLLLADDSVTIQRVIELTFADEDIQVVVVNDGRQAIERLRAERPDVVLADIGMPERDGYDVAAFIKGDPDLSHIPVILLTGAFEPLDENRARAVGCDGVLVKPFEPQMVINRVKELLAGHRPSTGWAPVSDSAPASRPAPQPARVAESEPPRAAPATAAKAPETLEDYFDRLDAAFANVGVRSPAAPTIEREPEDLTFGLDDLPPPAPARAAGGGDPLTSWDPELAGDFGPARQPQLANAFAALLAAEEGHPMPQSIAGVLAPPSPALTEDVIEDIVRRVIARLGDESMRRMVLDTAERLVREEIDRIKRASREPGSGA